jgi:uncharacterized protein
MFAAVRRAGRERRARWESLCLRCGKCCYEKKGRGRGIVTDWRRPCVHLDTRTHLCTIYETRFSLCPQCRRMTLRHALFVRWLPESCGYVRRYRIGGRRRAEGTVTARR